MSVDNDLHPNSHFFCLSLSSVGLVLHGVVQNMYSVFQMPARFFKIILITPDMRGESGQPARALFPSPSLISGQSVGGESKNVPNPPEHACFAILQKGTLVRFKVKHLCRASVKHLMQGRSFRSP